MGELVELQQLESSDGEIFRQLYAIYAASISAREQKPEGWLASMVGAPGYRFIVVKADGVVRGFSILFIAAAEGFALLEYMAVAPDGRNQGFGARLFQKTVARALAPDGRALPVVLEIDADREAASDQAMRTRRIGFYRRLGCRRLAGLRYLMPLPGDGPAPEMDLFLSTPAPTSAVPRAELRRWLATIYQTVYRCAPDDPRIEQMLAGLPDPVPLE
ncbi:MAG TPA: GNAT family N-acetyltransferase [Polyangia bacterium]|nr:GNAT family N-acetyltransferase [Polyangia bacterium]